MKKTIEFPKDFIKTPHALGDGDHYRLYIDDEVRVSVIFGVSFYSNGINTYEMLDFREDEPQGYLTSEEINEHLKNNPF